MYKKQIKSAKTSGSVIKLKKNSKTGTSGKSCDSKHKNESAEQTRRMEDKGKYFVNSKIHFHPDVPEQVQEFIKRISSDSKQNEKKMENSEPPRLPSHVDDVDLEDDPSSLSRKPSVQVIVTTEFTPNYLSNSDYDKLKEVRDKG